MIWNRTTLHNLQLQQLRLPECRYIVSFAPAVKARSEAASKMMKTLMLPSFIDLKMEIKVGYSHQQMEEK